MSSKKTITAIVAVLLLLLFSQATGDDTIYRSEHYILTNPRITCGGGEARSEHYTLTNVQIGNIAGGEAKSEHYTLTAFPVRKRLPPEPPTIDPVPSPTNNPDIALTGTKDKNTSICVNGYEAVPIDSQTTWSIASYNIGEEDGPKALSVTSKNKYNLESPSVLITVTLDTTAPVIVITSPLDGVTINEAPITVTGTINEPCDVIVNGVLADVLGNTFTADNVNLRKGENTITAAAYDLVGNYAEDTIIVTSTATSDYDITKITQDIYEYDPTNIIAGSQVELTVKLEIDGEPAANEPIQFQITQGNGSMAQTVVNTNANGEATGTLSTDVNANTTNLIEVFDQNYPSKKVTFHIDTKAGAPATIVKLTDENIHPVPGAEIDLIVRLEDANGNSIPDNQITYQVTSGSGTLSSSASNTNEYGNAKVKLTTAASPNTLCVIQAQATSNPGLTTTFNIITSGAITLSADDVIAKVNANDRLIKDAMADITVTSNAPWAPPVTQLKIWQKGDKQKVQELSPDPGIHIRPPAETGTPVNMIRTIISYNPATNTYTIKSIQEGQTEEYPYQIDCVDYGKGVIIQSERYIKDGEYTAHFVTEYSNFMNIGGIWGFQTMTEETYDGMESQLYQIISSYSNALLSKLVKIEF